MQLVLNPEDIAISNTTVPEKSCIYCRLKLSEPKTFEDVTLKALGKAFKFDLTSSRNLKVAVTDMALSSGFNTNCMVLLSQSIKYAARVNLLNKEVNTMKEGMQTLIHTVFLN